MQPPAPAGRSRAPRASSRPAPGCCAQLRPSSRASSVPGEKSTRATSGGSRPAAPSAPSRPAASRQWPTPSSASTGQPVADSHVVVRHEDAPRSTRRHSFSAAVAWQRRNRRMGGMVLYAEEFAYSRVVPFRYRLVVEFPETGGPPLKRITKHSDNNEDFAYTRRHGTSSRSQT